MGLCSKLKVGSLQKNNECRAVKKFLSRRLIMNARRIWNLHKRNKFLRAEASRDILKFRVSEMSFPGGLKRYFPPRMPCCFIRIHATDVLQFYSMVLIFLLSVMVDGD